MNFITLDKLKKGQAAYLDRSRNVTSKLFGDTSMFGAMIGIRLEVLTALGSMLIILLGENKIVIDKDLASSIWVEIPEILV